jgi:hypothetical protein
MATVDVAECLRTEHQELVEQYEAAYQDQPETSECGDLEDRLEAAIRLGDLEDRMNAAGLQAQLREIHAAPGD